MKEFKTFTDFRYNIHLIPEVVALDVIVRIQDWLMSGGSLEDEYIKKQLNSPANLYHQNQMLDARFFEIALKGSRRKRRSSSPLNKS